MPVSRKQVNSWIPSRVSGALKREVSWDDLGPERDLQVQANVVWMWRRPQVWVGVYYRGEWAKALAPFPVGIGELASRWTGDGRSDGQFSLWGLKQVERPCPSWERLQGDSGRQRQRKSSLPLYFPASRIFPLQIPTLWLLCHDKPSVPYPSYGVTSAPIISCSNPALSREVRLRKEDQV